MCMTTCGRQVVKSTFNILYVFNIINSPKANRESEMNMNPLGRMCMGETKKHMQLDRQKRFICFSKQKVQNGSLLANIPQQLTLNRFTKKENIPKSARF